MLHRNARNGYPGELIREDTVGKSDQESTNLLCDLDAPGFQVTTQGKLLWIAVQSGQDEWFCVVGDTLEPPVK